MLIAMLPGNFSFLVKAPATASAKPASDVLGISEWGRPRNALIFSAIWVLKSSPFYQTTLMVSNLNTLPWIYNVHASISLIFSSPGLDVMSDITHLTLVFKTLARNQSAYKNLNITVPESSYLYFVDVVYDSEKILLWVVKRWSLLKIKR